MTDLINSYALLPENVSFLERFYRPRIYFIRYFNNPTEITRNYFRQVFLKSHKYLREMFLRRLRLNGDLIEIFQKHLMPAG